MTGGRKTGDYQPSVTKISDLVILVGLGLGWARLSSCHRSLHGRYVPMLGLGR